MEVYNVKAPASDLAKLRAIAEEEDRTVASLVRLAIRRELERREGATAAGGTK
jgi:predicted transcriptional regulator